MFKKGDTLVEVLLAVGIFSMIAISVIAVMNGGTSEAQLALETTLTREEIDAQADALRYVHDSYLNDRETGNPEIPSVDLWQAITSKAVDLSATTQDEEILNYAPTQCTNIKDNTTLSKYAFVLNPRQLNKGSSALIPANPSGGKPSIFGVATTYPHLVFGSTESDDELITSDTASNQLIRAEGIYVIAVKDAKTTDITTQTGDSSRTEAFYDFYIRSCWYGTNTDTPSTISTVIRLHDPDVLKHDVGAQSGTINGIPVRGTTIVFTQKYFDIINNNESLWPARHSLGWTLDGYCLKEKLNPDGSCNGRTYGVGSTYQVIGDAIPEFVPAFTRVKYTITYDSNGSSWTRDNQICYQDSAGPSEECIVEPTDITRSGYAFGGWCDGTVDTKDGTCTGKKYNRGDVVPIPSGFKGTKVTLKAIWRERNEKITVKLTFNDSDCDSHVQGQKSDNSTFHAYYGNKVGSDVSGLTIAQLDYDRTSGGTETFTINTLGGKNYYYYVHNYSGCNLSSSGTYVTVSGETFSPITYYSDKATGSGSNWNVFAYKDGRIVTPGANGGTTRSSSPNLSY